MRSGGLKVQAQGGRHKLKIVVALMRKLTAPCGMWRAGKPLTPASSARWAEKVQKQATGDTEDNTTSP